MTEPTNLSKADGPSPRSIEHNLNDVWTVLRRQGESIAKIDQGQNSIVAALGDLRQEIRSTRDIATKPHPPTNWIAIATLCLGILIAGGAFTGSVIRPVAIDAQQALDWQTARSATLISDYRDFGIIGRQAKDAHDIASANQLRIANAREKLAFQEGLMEATREQLRDVDLGKSRGWNRGSRSPE